jgi:signal transduction histidine kinase
MRGLINNLLDVNMIEEGKFASEIEPCDMGLLTQQCIEHNSPSASQKQIKIVAEVLNNIHAAADKQATAQVLDNLVSNAIKYTFRNTKVHIRMYTEGKSIIVSVRDEGPGISADDQKRLFQKFSRLTARPTGGESSTGLGLAIAKRLAEAMSGSVDCESTLNAGTTFKLRLPLFVDGAPKKMAANATATAKLRWQAAGQRD